MKILKPNVIKIVSGGQQNPCQSATLQLLEQCVWSDLQFINSLFKETISIEQAKGSDVNTIVAALIVAVQKADYNQGMQ